MFYRSMILGLMLLALCAPAALAAGDDVPTWVQQSAAIKAPAYEVDVPAVVLHDEQVVSVESDGRITTNTTHAVRILTREGRAYAEAVALYLTGTGKVKELRAWLIRANGEVIKYDKDRIVDKICSPQDIYDECRLKLVNGMSDADVGAVFAYQSVTEELPLFSQDRWSFQSRLPTLFSRYTLALPSGWHATSVTFNHPNIEPVVKGSTYSWELRDLAPIEPEPASPKVSNLAPRLAVRYFPAEGSSAQARLRSFESWAEVSRWGTAIHEPQSVPDEAIAAKTRQLTANAKTEFERIRAVGRFVQDLQYISVDIGVGRGNGYRPHTAAQALAKLYGDCKDKANLMRTMLKTINITSYPVFIYLGDRTFVRNEWTSPDQFNHCILAIKVSDETQAATVINHPKLGRLLIFDATDAVTPIGDLPDLEQGSLALIVAGDDGALMRMPLTPPEANSLDRQSDVVLDADGSIKATVRERSMGQQAADERRLFRSLARPDYNGVIERWIARGANGASVSKVDPADDNADGRFALDVEFTARSYGQLMQNRLLVFRPAIITQRAGVSLTGAKRHHPIMLDAEAYNETVRVKLPAGFLVDELPDAVKLDAGFGTFTASYEVKDGDLVFTRTLVQRAATIPVEDYAKVKSFFAGMRSAEQAPVVLAKK